MSTTLNSRRSADPYTGQMDKSKCYRLTFPFLAGIQTRVLTSEVTSISRVQCRFLRAHSKKEKKNKKKYAMGEAGLLLRPGIRRRNMPFWLFLHMNLSQPVGTLGFKRLGKASGSITCIYIYL